MVEWRCKGRIPRRAVTVETEIDSGADDALAAVGLGAGVGDVIALAIERNDEHGASVEITAGLVGSDFRRLVTLGVDVSNTFAEGAAAEFFGAAEEVNGIVRTIGSEEKLHGAEMLVAKGEKVHPHAKASVAFWSGTTNHGVREVLARVLSQEAEFIGDEWSADVAEAVDDFHVRRAPGREEAADDADEEGHQHHKKDCGHSELERRRQCDARTDECVQHSGGQE